MRAGATHGRMKAAPWAMIVVSIGLLLMPAAPQAESLMDGFILQDPPKSVPRIEFKNKDEKTLTLADFQGKVVLLNLWATWCAPCRREMPTLDRLQGALGGPKFEVVALSLDRNDKQKVADFLSDIGISYLAFYQDRTFKSARALRAIGLPTTLLIDREGKEIGRLLGPAEWDSPEAFALIEKYLKSGGKALEKHNRHSPRPVGAPLYRILSEGSRDQVSEVSSIWLRHP